MNYFYILIFLCFGYLDLLAQCPTNITVFTHQSQIDSFIILYPNCTDVDGSIEVNGSGINNLLGFSNLVNISGDLGLSGLTQADLPGLENIDSIGGNLRIQDCQNLNSLNKMNSVTYVGKGLIIVDLPSLKNFDGLNKLKTIEEGITVRYLDSLENFVGLDSIESLPLGLVIADNDALKSLMGLENLKSISNTLYVDSNKNLEDLSSLSGLLNFDSDLHIGKNSSLKTLNGLENISHISGWLWIGENNSLKNVDGLNGLVSIDHFEVEKNDSLENLNGLENLEFIEDRFNISYNPQLKNFSGLEKLTTILGKVDIRHNTSLENIYGLQSLHEVGDLISIVNNDSLAQCDIFSVCSAIANGNGIFIEDNAEGCNNEDEVLLTCGNLFSRVSGKIFVDLNCDGNHEDQDIFFPYYVLKNADDAPFAATNFAGEYNKLLLQDEVYNYYIPSISGYSPNPNNYSIVTDSTIQWYSAYDFSLCPDSLFSNLSVTLEPMNFARPGFENSFFICAKNIGTQAENGMLTIHFDEDISNNLTITNSSGGTISNSTISWNIDSLPLFQEKCYAISYVLSPSTSLGTTFQIRTEIELLGNGNDVDLLDNLDSNSINVVGSFDPNDKIVNQTEIGYSDSLGKTRLEYYIRFQNTGTYPATFVEVLDTIPENLDIRSFAMIATSHDCELSFPEDNVLKWRFDNINLPDSASNEAESHGFILFSIETKPDLSLIDIIRNRAGIYFDFNEPVITNYAITNFVVGTNERKDLKPINLNVFPNPSNGENLKILIEMEKSSNCQISLVNSHGNIVHSHSMYVENGQSTLNLEIDNLAPGIYFIQVSSDYGYSNLKLLIH